MLDFQKICGLEAHLASTIHIPQGCNGGRRHTVEIAEDPIFENRRKYDWKGGNKQQNEILLGREPQVIGNTIKQNCPAFWTVETNKNICK